MENVRDRQGVFQIAYDSHKLNKFFIYLLHVHSNSFLVILMNDIVKEDETFKVASLDQKLSKYLESKTVKKRFYIPKKILNIIFEHRFKKLASL